MSFGGSSTSQFKAFVSEDELEKRKKKRQEEWEKVRTPDQPLDCPEEEYDPKSLFDRLKEQKDRKQAEYEEAHRLKNLIKGLDDDEVAFLELVDKAKLEMESKRMKEDLQEIQEYRKAVANLSEEAEKAKLKEFKKVVSNQNNSSLCKKQSNLVKVVKRKSSDSQPPAKRINLEKTGQSQDEARILSVEQNVSSNRIEEENSSSGEDVSSNAQGDVANASGDASNDEPGENYMYRSSLKCIGVLPGLGAYSDSSDSDNSSSSDIDPDSNCYDLVGRRLTQVTRTQYS